LSEKRQITVVSLSSCLLKARHKATSRTRRPRSATNYSAGETTNFAPTWPN